VFQHQLCAILVNAGFPEERLSPQSFNFTGPDRNLDVVMFFSLCHYSVCDTVQFSSVMFRVTSVMNITTRTTIVSNVQLGDNMTAGRGRF